MTNPDSTGTDISSTTADLDALEESLDDLLATVGSGDPTTDTTSGAPTTPAPTTADVTGDPQTATYSTDPTPSSSVPVTEPVDPALSADPTTDPASADPSVNAAIGVDGEVDYFSPRDVDGDGSIDVAHSRVDGIDTITNYDENGEITLIEQDTDGNGTYDTAASLDSDGTVRVADDLDDDGYVDLVTNVDPTTDVPVRQELIDADGNITEALLDTDGDGAPDAHLLDTDGDGRFDTAVLDTDADGVTNETLVDTDNDGAFDLSSVDTDYDGTQETTVAAPEDGAFGSIDAYESYIPADDGYHTQAGTYPTETPDTHDQHTDL